MAKKTDQGDAAQREVDAWPSARAPTDNITRS
jgi:hypothetical protein